ncbi:aldehyde dehydrogenase family protein [Amycolatopsis oliviviridis]|uniref:Aldehyde dehydrogenase n=1 Tax=Amycolatopsis oliviviridis TaxID=1471590 RepID=A0ABQ3LXM4_9PSEU|nr:aldehyde dehydrogenase family protein [Amycolatopsis oliviviridis]GHH28319.1 aldehyde dehydrogenase [Amycolatopsis oliviviridis]
MTTADLFSLSAIGVSGPYRTLRPLVLNDVTGRPIAELSVVPSGYVSRTVAAVRTADGMPAAERLAAIKRAAAIFSEGVVNGLDPVGYRNLVSRGSGIPLRVVTDAAQALTRVLATIETSSLAGRPGSAACDWRDPGIGHGRAVWGRRGDVLAVIAAGNHPAVHGLWLEALAVGYRVVLRPSTQEPFTPHRLVAALHEAGIGRDQLVLLPTEHSQVDRLIDLADFALVYGGDEVTRKYAANPKVLVQGPGRAKIVITDDVQWEDHLDAIVASIADDAGLTCRNTTAVYAERRPTELAEAVAERLGVLRALPPEHEEASLPVATEEGARRLEAYLRTKAKGASAVPGFEGAATPLEDGGAVLRPALHVVAGPGSRQTGIEMPFPCAWFAPWDPSGGLASLHGSLVVTALTEREDLIDALVENPAIGNVHIGGWRTDWFRPGLPHDGFLSEFLMSSKTVARRQ